MGAVERTGQAMLGDAIPETWDRMVRLYRARDAPLFQDVQHVSVDPVSAAVKKRAYPARPFLGVVEF